MLVMALARAVEEVHPAIPMDERRHLPALLAVLLLSNLSAYGRDATIAAVFGVSARTDAYFVGAFLPTLLVTILILESAVPALVPVFTRVAAHDAATRMLLRASLIASLAVLLCALAVLWIAAVPIVHVLTHGWSPEQVGRTASLMRITSGSLVPIGAGAVLAVVLNVRHRYLAPPAGFAVMNVAVMASTLLLGGRLGIYAPAWGMLVGSGGYLLLLVCAVGRLRLAQDRSSVSVRFTSIGRALLPMLLFSCLAQNVTVVERWLASMLPAGQISYLAYAGKLMMSPLLVISAASGLLAFVAMSHASAADDRVAFRTSLVRSARMLTILLAMATLVLILLREQIVRLALQHGNFTVHDTGVTAALLAIYALGLVPNGLSWLLYRSLQSRGCYWETVRIGILAAAVYVSCATALFGVWGLKGIAAAFPLSQVVSCVVLYARQPSFLRVPPAHGLRFAATISLLCGGISVMLVALNIAIDALPIGATVRAALIVAGAAVLVPACLQSGLRALRVPEGALFHAWLKALVEWPAR